MKSKKWRNKNFLEALKHSCKGIFYVLKNERNLKIQLLFAILAIILSIFFKLNFVEFAIIIVVIGMVFFAEFINTVIEIIFDVYSEEYNEKIKVGKDISSGAVLVMAIVSVVVGAIVFLPRIYVYFFKLMCTFE